MPTSTPLAVASAGELAAAIRAGELSSRELLAYYLDRIARLDGEINSVVTLDPGAADDAAAADAEWARGEPRGPLHGVPVTIKDALETAGLRSTGGASELADHVPSVDAPAVARLRAAGAIVFGKTNLPRWSGDMQTYNDLFGLTRNPWAPDDSPGGSSGGAAAAVACGFTAFELGTDIGGSIRIPSHLCGTFGLRPTYGLVPTSGYLAGTARGQAELDVNVLGPIARSAADLDLLLDVLAGPAAGDAVAWRLDLPPAPERPLRVGLWLDDPYCRVDAGYLAILRRLADRLDDAGVEVVDTRPDLDFAGCFETYWTLLAAAGGLDHPDAPLTHSAWLAAHEARHAQRAAWARWFDGVDALLAPVLAVARYPHDLDGDYLTRTVVVNGAPRSHADIARWTGLVGALGLPVAVGPAGALDDGRPVGVQVVAARWRDRTAIRLAGLVAEVSGGFRAPFAG